MELKLNEFVKVLDKDVEVTIYSNDRSTVEFENTVEKLKIIFDKDAGSIFSSLTIDDMVIFNNRQKINILLK